eukprot:TRINITY_DN84881_c0_g1_i1.p1 TRINITY_DN84881_c0_g1~~TRINITY_DN84881_c0_g1_i1.p1  ORF type:complete len:118 (-),score=12.21 TRINITY_DN84881_c0_g1_i1:65-418(-)
MVDPGACIFNSEVWVSGNAVSRAMMMRQELSGTTVRKSLREAGVELAGRSGQASTSSLTRARSTPSMDTLGLSTNTGSFGPKFRAPAGAVPGHGHPTTNGSWGFSNFYNSTGSTWLK